MNRVVTSAALLLLPAAALAGFSASSHKVESRTSGASPYEAAAALDGNPATSWQIDPEQENKGQWIEIDVPKGKVDKISLIVGWAKNDDAWQDHARLKAARVEVFSMANDTRKLLHEQELSFADAKEVQTFDLPDQDVGDEFAGGAIRLTVTDVYPGKDYAHLAVGEVLIHMGEFDATLRKVQGTSSAAEGHDGEALVDDSTRTYWLSDPKDEAPSFEVDAGRFSESSVGILPGPKTNARPKRIEVSQGSGSITYDVLDNGKMQWFMLPTLFGYTGSNFGSITVKIVETWPGTSPGVGVADVRLKAVALEAF
ncbi:MAG: discoidin domain-containing protein [Alphaproteobacteria bacterium]|nr:discoidin domain-containing protein [Alphaproteobacteria bacterium]